MITAEATAGTPPTSNAKARASADRRSEAISGAIEVLAERGARGLTHREIDRYLQWPLGSTSNYFRRRLDIFTAIAARIMESDLADLAIVDADLAKPGGISVDMLVDHTVHLIAHSMAPHQRSRSLARAEILFERIRNKDIRDATDVQFGMADALFERIFQQLGSVNPAASACFMTTMMPAAYVGLSIANRPLDKQQIEAIVRNWIAISLAQAPAAS